MSMWFFECFSRLQKIILGVRCLVMRWLHIIQARHSMLKLATPPVWKRSSGIGCMDAHNVKNTWSLIEAKSSVVRTQKEIQPKDIPQANDTWSSPHWFEQINDSRVICLWLNREKEKEKDMLHLVLNVICSKEREWRIDQLFFFFFCLFDVALALKLFGNFFVVSVFSTEK